MRWPRIADLDPLPRRVEPRGGALIGGAGLVEADAGVDAAPDQRSARLSAIRASRAAASAASRSASRMASSGRALALARILGLGAGGGELGRGLRALRDLLVGLDQEQPGAGGDALAAADGEAAHPARHRRGEMERLALDIAGQGRRRPELRRQQPPAEEEEGEAGEDQDDEALAVSWLRPPA